MSEKTRNLERRASSLANLTTLVSSRTDTLALLNQLASMRPFEPEPEVQDLLQDFCGALVDYAASAHFQLYQYVEEGNERRKTVLRVAREVYPRIVETTSHILDFNDAYDCEGQCDNLSELDGDLSRLGEVLADRIALEDRVIEAMGGAR